MVQVLAVIVFAQSLSIATQTVSLIVDLQALNGTEQSAEMASNTVFYHYPCPDGAFAAFCAHLALSNVRWCPMTVYSKPEDRLAQAAQAAGTTAYVLDYTGGPDFLRAVASVAKEVYVLDHHKTAAEDCAGVAESVPNLHLTIDMGRSGAGIARDHFAVKGILESKYGADRAAALSLLIDYVEDNDLWRHTLADSKAVALGLGESKIEFDANKNAGLWEQLASLTVPALLASGQAAQARQDAIITAEMATARPMTIPGPHPMTALAVVTQYPDYRSVAGNTLAALSVKAGHPAIGIIAYTEPGLAPGPDGKPLIKVSLRSIGEVDTTPCSKAFGGGGHKNASSFNVAVETFETWWLAK